MPNIEKAKNHKGETIFPVTVADAVLTGNGKSLKTELSELGSEVGRGVLTLELTETHSSTKDKIPVDVEEGDIVFINLKRSVSTTLGQSVFFYNSKTGAQESHDLRFSEINKIEVGGTYDSMGIYVGVEGPVTIIMEYYTYPSLSSYLNSGVMGIIGEADGKSYPNIDSNTGDMTFSSSVTLIVNGVNFSIQPHTFNLKNNVLSSLTKVVYDIKTQLCKAVMYNTPTNSYEVVIGVVRTKYTEDGSFSSLYHVFFPFEYSIDGKTMDDRLTEIRSTIDNCVLVGKNNTGVSFKYTNIINGHRYRIYCKNPNWDVSNLTIGNEQYIFEIYTVNEGASNIAHGVNFENKGTIKDYYDVVVPEEYSKDAYMVIYIRGNKGEEIPFVIEDSTNIIYNYKEDRNNMFFIGDGSNFVSTKFRGVVGRRYKLTLLQTSWSYPSSIGDDVSVFYIGAHTEAGSETLKSYNKTQTIPNSFTFDYKGEYTDVYIGGRALRNEKVFFLIEDVSQQKFNDKIILVGDKNNGVTSKILLQKNVDYTVFLPEEKWNTDEITLNYEYYYYELYYYKEGSTTSTVVNGLTSLNTYKNRFVFTAPETTEYTLYIRGNKGVEIPIFVIPCAETVYEGQLDKIRSLGFKRRPDTFDEGYIPNLVFMHMSDTHCKETSYQASFKKSVYLFDMVSSGNLFYGNALKFILHTGDVRNSHYSDGYSFFDVVTKGLKKNIYVTPGNHDVGNDYNVSNAGTNEDIYNQMIAPMLDKWQLNSDGIDLPHVDGKNYYFNDFTEEKVRMIVLYEYETNFDINDSDPTLLVYHRGYRAFSQGQIDWLIQTLKNTPQGYGVIIAKHQPESVDGFTDNPFYSNMLTEKTHMQSYCGTELIAQIVQAFIDRTTFSTTIQQTGGIVTILNVNADFSGLSSSEFICYCSGHTHLDMITKLKNYPKQIELNIGPNNTHYTNGSDIYQNGEGLTRLLTNVYSIDRNRGYIYVVRLGANFSNTAQYRDFISLKYK